MSALEKTAPAQRAETIELEHARQLFIPRELGQIINACAQCRTYPQSTVATRSIVQSARLAE
eukprot:243620-Lingulodinium_polyedra.AAC.1